MRSASTSFRIRKEISRRNAAAKIYDDDAYRMYQVKVVSDFRASVFVLENWSIRRSGTLNICFSRRVAGDINELNDGIHLLGRSDRKSNECELRTYLCIVK